MNLDIVYEVSPSLSPSKSPSFPVQVILPLFEMKKAVLICISSPVGSYNFYTKVRRQRGEGRVGVD